MEKNVGGLDRTARFAIGIVLGIAGIVILAGYWALGTTIGAVALIVGLILLVTGATQTCPINQVVGIDTTK